MSHRTSLGNDSISAWEPGLVSIVVLNWNGGDEVLTCVDHLVAQTYPRLEILLVDNGSVDGSIQAIRGKYPQVPIWENGRNLGYAGGMNVGIAQASGEFVILVNQDAFLKADYLEKAVRLFRSDETIGMIAATVLKLDSKWNSSVPVQICGWMMRWHIRFIANQDCTSRRAVFGPMFACAVIRRSALEDVRCKRYGDYFDQDYFSYLEDMDLCFRVLLRGWQTIYSPDLVVWHHYGSATGGRVKALNKPLFLQRHFFKNRYITIIKDLPLAILIRVIPVVVVTDVLIVVYLLLRSPRSLLAWVAACFDVVRLLPKILERRKGIQGRVIISTRQLQQYFIRL